MIVELGTVIAPSGALLIIDAGMLGMWSHDLPPEMPDGVLPPELTAVANSAVDHAILGRDAAEVGRELGRQWHPRYLYDLPRHVQGQFSRAVQDIAAARRLDARLEVLPARVPHRRRADHALAHGAGAGEVVFHGMSAGVVRGLPGGELRVVAEPMPEGDPDEGRLRSVTLVVREGAVARSERFAHAAVDWSRILLVDLDAVGRWQHDESLDGRADFAFWGRDAEEVARRTGAAALDDEAFGWRDLPIEDAVEHGMRVEDLCAREELLLATDFRPHSHHYHLMEQVRASGTGTVLLGPACAFGFSTTWGDGFFDLHRILDRDGNLLSIRIELATDERRAMMRQLEAGQRG